MKPVVLILADDEFLGDDALAGVRAEYAAKGFEVEERAAREAQELAYALGTLSLLGGGRLVVVRDAADLTADTAKQVAAWAADAPPGVALALVGGGARLRKALGDAAQVIEVPSVRFREAEWLVERARSRGGRMAREAAQALVEAVGTDLRELATALDQLTSSVDGPIEVADVHGLFRGLETELWNFIDAVFDRDRGGAHARLQTLLARGENAIGITTALANQLRLIALVRGERRPTSGLARELGVKEGKLRRALRQAKNFGPEEIRRAYRLLADGDVALKGGERGEDEPAEIVLELLVAEILGDARPATRPS